MAVPGVQEAYVTKGKGGGIYPEKELNAASNAVCSIFNHRTGKHGTGFIGTVSFGPIAVKVLVTNWHVIPKLEDARHEESTYDFKYLSTDQKVTLHGNKLFSSDATYSTSDDKELDFFIATVNSEYLSTVLSDVKAIELKKTHVCPKEDDLVFVIQHPESKERSLSHWKAYGAKGPYLFYGSNTTVGSSGSPVMMERDGKLELVGLHRGTCPVKDPVSNFGSLVSAILTLFSGGNIQSMISQNELDTFLTQIKREHFGGSSQETEQNESGTSSKKQADKFDQSVTRKILNKMSDFLAQKWEKIGDELNVSSVTMINIAGEETTSKPQKCFKMLQAWQMQKNPPNFQDLKKAIVKLELSFLLSEIEKNCFD